MSRALALALAILAGALLAMALADEARAATQEVTISGSRFSPTTIEVREGDVVRWNNNDAISHSARSSGNWDTGTIQPNGGTGQVTMSAAGTYGYVCAFHPSMTGTVRVLEAVVNAPPAVAITSPTSGSSVSGTVNIVVAASDANGDALAVQLRIDNGEFGSLSRTAAGWSFSWDTRNVTQGAHTLTARANDGSTTTTSGSISVTVNNPPTITLIAPVEDARAEVGDLVGVTGTTTSPFGQTVVVEVSIDGGEWTAAVGRTFWSYGWNTTGYTVGEHTVQARVRDALNTIVSPPRVVLLVEPVPDVPPELYVLSPAEGAAVAGLVNLTGNATDADGSVPFVEVSLDGVAWRNVTGRSGATWWFHWLPADELTGLVPVYVRATADEATVIVTRRVVLDATPASLTIELVAARESSPIVVRVVTANESPTPVASARVVLAGGASALVHEASTNATGYASLPSVSAGDYEVRALAPGAAGRREFEVRSPYDVNVTPSVIDYERPVPIVVRVSADKPMRNVPVHLVGHPLPGNSSDAVRTAGDGNATIVPQALTSGELAVYVAGNDTGLRVRIAPTVLATWSPTVAAPNDVVTVRLTLNDIGRTPIADKEITVDVPGKGRQTIRTDATGALTLRPNATGTLRVIVPREGFPGIAHTLAVRPGAPKPELSGLVTRAGPASLQVGALVKNAGETPMIFTVDALASNGVTLAHETETTRELAPGEEERLLFMLRAGVGEYDLEITVRNSTAALHGRGVVVDAGVPPALTPSNEPPPLPAALQSEEKKESPGAAVGALVALAAVALARRGRRA